MEEGEGGREESEALLEGFSLFLGESGIDDRNKKAGRRKLFCGMRIQVRRDESQVGYVDGEQAGAGSPGMRLC